MRKSVSLLLGALAALFGLSLAAMALAGPAQADAATARTELALSARLLKAGNYSAARSHAEAAIKADPGWGLAHAMLARSFLAIGNGVAAEGELDRARAAGFDPNRTHHLYAHAWLLQGDAARALAEAAQARAPYAGYAVRIGARALAAQGDPAAAQAALTTLLANAPDDSAAWCDLAQIKRQSGDIAGAIDAAQRAVALDGDNVAALTLRGILVRDQFGLVAALPWFEQALAHDAYYHPALIEYAATLGDVGRYTGLCCKDWRQSEVGCRSAPIRRLLRNGG